MNRIQFNQFICNNNHWLVCFYYDVDPPLSQGVPFTSVRFRFFASSSLSITFINLASDQDVNNFKSKKISILVCCHCNRIYVFPLPFISYISNRLPSSCLFSTEFRFQIFSPNFFSSSQYFG